jgi:hypothetical protein
MSERESEQGPAEDVAAPVEARSTSAVEPARRPRGSSGPAWAVLWLAALLILILAGVALSPFWAPQLAPLLPWSENRGEYAALAGRVAAVEERPVSSGREIDAVKSAVNAVTQRIDQLQTRLAEGEKRSPPPSVDIDAISSALNGLTRRIDRLEAAAKPDRQIEDAVAAVRAGMQQLEQRLTAIETQSASRAANETAASKDVQEQLSRLSKADADLADRVTTLEREGQAQGKADLRVDGMLALLLGQMREAIEQARPFPAEFNAFVSLARNSDLASAAEPLAEPARNGVASRAVLVRRLAELAGRMAVASEPAGESDWGAQTLARLRGLVTIRRIEGPSQTGSEAAVSAAQTALARGDLAGALAALDPLTGANAEAARPWMRMAKERLAAEAALDRLQELLTARLGSAPAPPPAPPGNSPDQPSEKARTRS